MIKVLKAHEKRIHPRYLLRLPGSLCVSGLSLMGYEKKRKRIIQGRIENISAGGLGLLTNQSLKVGWPIRGEVIFAKMPVAVPTLMAVQWSCQAPKNDPSFRYMVGLRFLL